jgi:Putative heavy-metal chelation
MTRHRPKSVPDPIVRETVATIRRVLGSDLQTITVERTVIGVFFTGVRLNNGLAGACATPIKTIPEAVCCPSSVMAMPFPGRLHGRRALDLLDETEAASGLRRAVGIATLNALADLCWQASRTLTLRFAKGSMLSTRPRSALAIGSWSWAPLFRFSGAEGPGHQVSGAGERPRNAQI